MLFRFNVIKQEKAEENPSLFLFYIGLYGGDFK